MTYKDLIKLRQPFDFTWWMKKFEPWECINFSHGKAWEDEATEKSIANVIEHLVINLRNQEKIIKDIRKILNNS